MVASKVSPNDRLARKRLAARLRQRRCRERKREARAIASQKLAAYAQEEASKVSHATDMDAAPTQSHSIPPRPYFRAPMAYGGHMPPYGPPPSAPYAMPYPQYQHGHPQFPHGPPPPPPPPGMMARHCYPGPPPPPHQCHSCHHAMAPQYHYSGPSCPPVMPRTVSRSPSESSMETTKKDSGSEAVQKLTQSPKKEDESVKEAEKVPKTEDVKDKKRASQAQKKVLASVEKAAVVAMLSLKTTSSDDASEATCSVTDESFVGDQEDDDDNTVDAGDDVNAATESMNTNEKEIKTPFVIKPRRAIQRRLPRLPTAIPRVAAT